MVDAGPPLASPALAATYFLDTESDVVRAFVDAHVTADMAPRKRATALFRAVRDGIRYDPYDVPRDASAYRASQILARPAGFCVPKAIALCAVARAAGIPARLGFADVTNHLATPNLLRALGTNIFAFHGYVELEVDGRRVKATPAFDRRLCQWFRVDPLEFDGEHDAVLQPTTHDGVRFMEYLHDYGLFDDFPADKMVEVWKRVYPHFFAEDGSVQVFNGDFAREARGEVDGRAARADSTS